MLAVLTAGLPENEDDYVAEYKWDGVRAIAYFDRGTFTIRSRNNLDITRRYPEMHALGSNLGRRRLIFDGEIIAMDAHNRPSFARLQRRMHVNDTAQIERLTREVPVFYMLFDVLYLDDRNTMKLPYADRRKLLEGLNLTGPHWQLTPAHRGQGKPMLKAAASAGLEGIVIKRFDRPYRPGKRSDCWLKIKIVHEQELVIGGWIPENGNRLNRAARFYWATTTTAISATPATSAPASMPNRTHCLPGASRCTSAPTVPSPKRSPRTGSSSWIPSLSRRWNSDAGQQAAASNKLRSRGCAPTSVPGKSSEKF